MHCQTERFSVGTFWVERSAIQLTPPYQREGSIWSIERKQLFLDSLFNNYDVPKIYMHDLRRDSGEYNYTLIDGKQRLGAIWDFLDGEVKLGDGFEYKATFRTNEKDYPEAGDSYYDLTNFWKERFKNISLDVVMVNDADEYEMEEIFSRLNNGEPLNAAEKRNAMGGRMCAITRTMPNHRFFKQTIYAPNKRYLHNDIAARFLLIEYTADEDKNDNPYCDLKKRFLDALVKDNKKIDKKREQRIVGAVTKRLDSLVKVFGKQDVLLRRMGYPQLYYLFVREMEKECTGNELHTHIKKFLENFNDERTRALDLPVEDKTSERHATLSEFERLMQQGNDKGSLKDRVWIMRNFFLEAYPKFKQ